MGSEATGGVDFLLRVQYLLQQFPNSEHIIGLQNKRIVQVNISIGIEA